MLKNVEAVLQPCDQAGREGGKEEEREGMAEKGKKSHLVFRLKGAGVGKEDRTWKNPPPSQLNRVALNSHVEDRQRETVVRQDHAALTHESPGNAERWVSAG